MDIKQMLETVKSQALQHFEIFKNLDPQNKHEDRAEFAKYVGVIIFVLFWIRFLMLRSKAEQQTGVTGGKKDKKKD